MAKAAFIGDFEVLADGRVMVAVTRGDTPLPEGAVESLEFANKQAFMEEIAAAELRIANDLHLIQAGKALKADPNMGNTFKNAYVGKTPMIDLTGIAITLSLP